MTRLKNSGGKTTQHNGPYSFLAEADCRCLRGRTVIEDVGSPLGARTVHEKRDQDVNEKVGGSLYFRRLFSYARDQYHLSGKSVFSSSCVER